MTTLTCEDNIEVIAIDTHLFAGWVNECAPEIPALMRSTFFAISVEYMPRRTAPLTPANTNHRQVEMAVEDLICVAEGRTAGVSTETSPAAPREELRRHYNNLMYRAVLSCTKASLTVIKKKACAKVLAA